MRDTAARHEPSLDTSMKLKSRTTAKMTTWTKTKSTVSTTLETKMTRVLEKIILTTMKMSRKIESQGET